MIAQVASAVFGGPHSVGFFYLQATTALILVLAANTAFNGFPLLGSILARDRNLPAQLNNRGDRLAYSNGIVAARRRRRRADRDLPRRHDPADPALHHRRVHLVHARARAAWSGTGTGSSAPSATRWSAGGSARSRAINGFGASFTGLVLVIVVITKFTNGAYLVIIAMPILYALMRAINRHYTRRRRRSSPARTSAWCCRRATTSIVLVSKVHKPTLRALAFARATRPDTLTALTVNVDDEDTRGLHAEWERHDLPGPAHGAGVAVPRGHAARSWTTSRSCAPTGRATSSACSSPSTSSATGGSTCCTTSRRCGSRPGCCSSRA